MNTKFDTIKGGLKPLQYDARDFKMGAVFGTPNLKELPDEFVFKPLEIKDQQDLDFCAGFSVAEASEPQENVKLNPYFQFAMAKRIEGSIEQWGTDLRTACKGACDYGSIPEGINEFIYPNFTRDFLADWNNWKSWLDIATIYKKKSYFSVFYYGVDDYDAIKLALWQHKKDKRIVITGAMWRSEWQAKDGKIPTTYGAYGTPHAFVIIGWNKDGLVCQLSNGTEFGNNGLFYMPRSVANKELVYGKYMLIDISPDEAKYRHQYPVLIAKLLVQIKKLKDLLYDNK